MILPIKVNEYCWNEHRKQVDITISDTLNCHGNILRSEKKNIANMPNTGK